MNEIEMIVTITQKQADFVEGCRKYNLSQWQVLESASTDCYVEVIALVKTRPFDLLFAYKYGYLISEKGTLEK